ncbi:TPA: glycosyltransferase [Streptococcus suis]
MKILHYTLGFNPQRTGGLISYVNDIINEQVNQGNEVLALYPANQNVFFKRVKIKKINDDNHFIKFELFNSLPLPLFGGISEPHLFMVNVGEEEYIKFLQEQKPDIIHVHSLMGLHLEFFKAARKLGIRIFFTSHDYFGLSPLPTFYYNGISFDKMNTNLAWNIMSADALSVRKLRIFQSKYYSTIRHFMKKLNKNPKHKQYKEISGISESIDFSFLREYYKQVFSYIDCFLFNSSISKNVFEENLQYLKHFEIIHMSYSDIDIFDMPVGKGNRIGYIGPDEEYKGYFEFLELANRLKNTEYEFLTFGHYPNHFAPKHVHQNGRYLKNERRSVFEQIDYLLVPSRWKETFGLIVVEAIQNGVTVITSNNVGAKDLLPSKNIVNDIKEISEFSNFEKIVNANISKIDKHVKVLLDTYKKYGEL